jgi:phenylpropionate dioxygenase-like ring-hydroxylating dioxygenase large terminal subunit
MNAMLDYWHPVFPSRDLPPDRAVGIKVAGHSLALFRAGRGRAGAVADQCAHRRMKLSLGTVQRDKLVCPYHGWSFDGEGRGESPGAPRLRACVTSYDCAEACSVLWVKARGGTHELPAPTMNGWDFVGAVFNPVRAPLELVIDNFSEVEHTVTTHPDFGFDAAHADEAIVELEIEDDAVTVHNRGPAKMPPLDTRLAVGVRRGDHFHSNYTFRFDPPRSSVAHFWTEPRTGRERMLKYHVFHYFVPVDDATTTIVTFGFLKIRRPLLRHLGPRVGWLFRRKLRRTVDEDAYLLENLADQSPRLDGMKLSRFDQILGLTRERLKRIYYARAGSTGT